MEVNKNLSLKGCWKMVNSVDSLEKASIARIWLDENDLISVDDYNDLMMALSFIVRELYRG